MGTRPPRAISSYCGRSAAPSVRGLTAVWIIRRAPGRDAIQGVRGDDCEGVEPHRRSRAVSPFPVADRGSAMHPVNHRASDNLKHVEQVWHEASETLRRAAARFEAARTHTTP